MCISLSVWAAKVTSMKSEYRRHGGSYLHAEVFRETSGVGYGGAYIDARAGQANDLLGSGRRGICRKLSKRAGICYDHIWAGRRPTLLAQATGFLY